MKIVTPILVSAALLAAGCSTLDPISKEDRTLAFGCDDVVVVGQLSDLVAGETVHVEGHYLGHGWFEANLKVRERLYGDQVAEQVPVRYFAHTFMRGDKAFMFVLSLGERGYEVVAARLMSTRPIALDTCQ